LLKLVNLLPRSASERRNCSAERRPLTTTPEGQFLFWDYTSTVGLAEAGCSDGAIASVTGHKTLTMVQKNRAQANQKKLSKQAQALRNRIGTKRNSDQPL